MVAMIFPPHFLVSLGRAHALQHLGPSAALWWLAPEWQNRRQRYLEKRNRRFDEGLLISAAWMKLAPQTSFYRGP
jgi:hypothetical protein